MRALRSVAVERPGFSRDGRWHHGPDEDVLTLGVAVAEALRPAGTDWAPALDSIQLVGPAEPGLAAALPEALGAPDRTVRLLGPGPGSLAAALTAAAQSTGDGSALVLAVDLAGAAGAEGSGAVGFSFGPGPGWQLLGHTSRRHPAQRMPDATAWIATAGSSASLTESSRGSMLFVARSAAPVLLRNWPRTFPQLPVIEAPSEPVGLGASPTLPFALALAKLPRVSTEGDVHVAAMLHGETTDFLGIRSAGPVAWTGPTEFGPAMGALPADAPPPETVHDVSEGAYVPRPRYLENLPSRWRYVADRCGACGFVTFPQRGRCRGCGTSDRLVPGELPRSGTIEAVTRIAPGAQPTEFDASIASAGPYQVAILSLGDGCRATAMVAPGPGGAPRPGERAETRLRRLYAMEGEWRYGRKVLPVSSPGPGGP